MRTTESMITHERPNYWVRKCTDKGPGWFEVYSIGVTHSTRCATIHYPSEPEKARTRAIAECDRRQSEHDSKG